MAALRPPRLSLRAFSFFFVLFGLGVALALIASALTQLEHFSIEAEARHRKLAEHELRLALDQVLSETQTLAERLLEWDELYQQLSDVTYYEYWRDNRVSTAKFVPPGFLRLEVYDRTGMPLAKPGEGLPSRVSPADLGFSAYRTVEGVRIQYISRVQTRGPIPERIGFLAISLAANRALGKWQQFRYIDPESIGIDVPPGEMLDLDQLPQHIRFDTLRNDDFAHFKTLLVETLSRLGGLALALALALLYLLIAIVALPLRRLSRHIDALGEGAPLTPLPLTAPLRLVELEKLGCSLNQYHQQLSEKSRALRDREAHLRALLEHVPNGIMILNEQGNIVSLNPAAERLFGHWPSSLIGRPMELLIDPGYRAAYHQRVTSCRNWKDGPCVCDPIELMGRHRDGAGFYIELSVNQLGLDEERLYIAVVRDVTERKRSEEKLQYLANYDPLTGLPNRALFRDRLTHAIAHAHRDGAYVGLIFIDLDDFKRINDSLGHHIGDRLLGEVARRLAECMREADTVARLGGDEFTVILEGIVQPGDSAMVADKIISALSLPYHLEGQEVVVTPSLGITTYPSDHTDVDHLLKNADTAMYRAKERGGCGYRFFTLEMNRRMQQRLSLEGELRHALERQEFFLEYQPKIDIATWQVAGVEALLRWRHAERGVVSPAEFIPVLEETGMIDAVGKWVMATACSQAAAWRQAGLPPWCMSVNLSARQFRSAGLSDSVAEVLNATRLPASGLELEITEGLLVENVEVASALLDELDQMGVNIAIDDFGTGYSSLSYLKRFPISTLKVDQSFVRGLGSDPEIGVLATLIIDMAHSLGMKTVAEGVESKPELEFLRARGCDQLQGFLIGRPMTASTLEAWFAEREADRTRRTL